MSYLKYAAMIATGTVAMYAVMYMATWQLDHITMSESRIYMALAMGGIMAVVMLAYMWNMYTSWAGNIGIVAASIVLLGSAIYLDRSQVLVGDVDFMRSMIPHHSMAITRSERARISDPRVRDLANQIIEAQQREIDMMKTLIADLSDNR